MPYVLELHFIGIAPSDEVVNPGVALQPVMELKSHNFFRKRSGSRSSSKLWRNLCHTRDSTRIATIPVGYADGYPRSLSNKGYLLINGKKAPIIGRVCMDQFMVDVSDIPEAVRGTEVTLLGTDHGSTITAEELGDLSGRFSYELICCITKRVPRIYL